MSRNQGREVQGMKVGAFVVQAWKDGEGFLVVRVADETGREVIEVGDHPEHGDQEQAGQAVFTNNRAVIAYETDTDSFGADGRGDSEELLEASKDPEFRKWWMATHSGISPETMAARVRVARRREAANGYARATIALLKTAPAEKDKKHHGPEGRSPSEK